MPRGKGVKNTPQIIIKEIIEKHKQGKTRQELADEYSKPFKTIKAMINRENNKKRNQEAGILPKPRKGRPRKYPATAQHELELENKRLKMEVELLRDFLKETGRG